DLSLFAQWYDDQTGDKPTRDAVRVAYHGYIPEHATLTYIGDESRMTRYLGRMRWYDARLGRWLTRDPAGYVDGLNVYQFVGGNPLMFVDPLGLWGVVPNTVHGDWEYYVENGSVFRSRDSYRRGWLSSTYSPSGTVTENVSASTGASVQDFLSGKLKDDPAFLVWSANKQMIGVAADELQSEFDSAAKGAAIAPIAMVAGRGVGRVAGRHSGEAAEEAVAGVAAPVAGAIAQGYIDSAETRRIIATAPSSDRFLAATLWKDRGGKPGVGWKRGDPIDNYVSPGVEPTWETVRERYWMNVLHYEGSRYSIPNQKRMAEGGAAQMFDDELGRPLPKELSHYPTPQREGGKFKFYEVTNKEHAAMDPKARRLRR
ncbi:MAG: RHS repeat-associated core domain-containing protein, partial [Phycisphaerales bacterium]